MSVKEIGESITIFTAVDIRTSMSMAVVTPSKALNRYAITEFKRFIFESGRTYAIVQTDDESSIKAMIRGSVRELSGSSIRNAPTGSSESQGSVERFHQTLFAQVRVLRLALADRYRLQLQDIDVKHIIFPWMVKTCELAA